MSGACMGEKKKCIQDYGWEDCRNTTWKTGINGRIVLKWILSRMGNHGLVHLAKDMDMVVNILVS
jgi:hypothetical protein